MVVFGKVQTLVLVADGELAVARCKADTWCRAGSTTPRTLPRPPKITWQSLAVQCFGSQLPFGLRSLYQCRCQVSVQCQLVGWRFWEHVHWFIGGLLLDKLWLHPPSIQLGEISVILLFWHRITKLDPKPHFAISWLVKQRSSPVNPVFLMYRWPLRYTPRAPS